MDLILPVMGSAVVEAKAGKRYLVPKKMAAKERISAGSG